MVSTKLQELKDFFGHVLGKKGHAVKDLEISIRAKGNMTQREDAVLRACMSVANGSFMLCAVASTIVAFVATNQAHKFVGGQPLPRLLRFGICAGGGLVTGNLVYYASLHGCAAYILRQQEHEERLKMELANIILTEHSDEKSLVEIVQRHFFAEHLYSDQYQDKPLFRWRQHRSYVDSTYMERMKEIESYNSEDRAKTITGQTKISFADLMEDPLSCILGSPDSNMESDKPPEHAATHHFSCVFFALTQGRYSLTCFIYMVIFSFLPSRVLLPWADDMFVCVVAITLLCYKWIRNSWHMMLPVQNDLFGAVTKCCILNSCNVL